MKQPDVFDKKKLECVKCHKHWHFARECTSLRGPNDGKKRDSFYQDQGDGKRAESNCLLTIDDGVVNWGEHTVEEEETNHALMAISSNNKVSLCSKTCIDSYNKLKTLCDEQTNQLGEQEAKILAYTLAVKKLEAQVVTFQKQQLSLNEQLTFQANEIYAKDEKLKKYRRIGMKAVKEKEQLQKIKKIFLTKPLYSRFSKTDSFKGVPHPLTGDYTPKPQEEIDESLSNVRLVRSKTSIPTSKLKQFLVQSSTQEHGRQRFSWVFFLATKDETSGILQNFIRQIENQLNHRVKIIRSDNGTEFKNRDMLEFCGNKGIKQSISNGQNSTAEWSC
ncbi:ribonuclease H-like domain-containing protein [Tanacetum coccineum]